MDWEPAVIDAEIDDVSDETMAWFKERGPDSITGPDILGVVEKLDDADIEAQTDLREKFGDISRHDCRTGRPTTLWKEYSSEFYSSFSFSIPTSEALAYISSYDPVVELFAGNGYWAYELERAGAKVHPYDVDPPRDPWTSVARGTADALLEHRERNGHVSLLLCWPPVGPSAYDALLIARPKNLFFVGELPSNGWQVMGNPNFFKHIDAKYELEKTVELPSLPKMKDNCYHYRRAR